MQPYHLADDGRWAEKVLGPKRVHEAWPFRSLLDAKATLAFGSDWFVAPPEPLKGIAAAVTRFTLSQFAQIEKRQSQQLLHNGEQLTTSSTNPNGKSAPSSDDGAWIPKERISVEEALLAYTTRGAYASFEEDLKGKIRTGYLADLVLINRDLTAPFPQQATHDQAEYLWTSKVMLTIVDGRVAYNRLGVCTGTTCSL